MHIKKLEIAGFKSFVDRTVVHFDHDIIGIVGPNGCGKSNIVDAIRWCMGEQSAKHLRGASMSDVIFNGSESRKPSGLCEVTLTFDNSDAEYAASLPPEFRDYPEIAVTRRLFRDGTSEYLVNKTQVRLKDVTELFLGTGVGTKAYSIVEQGRIGQIVSARPEDRRRFIEEAAGITKYKARRKESERKMDQTRQNLLRINDIVSELDRTRGSLKRQAVKAERFLEHRAELEDLALHEASHKLLELVVVERVHQGARDRAAAEAEAARSSLEAQESGLEAQREEALGIENAADLASKQAFEADNEVSGLQAEIERSRERLKHLGERLAAGENESETLGVRLAALGTEVAQIDQGLEHLERDASERASDAEGEDRSLADLRESELGSVAAAQALRASVAEAQRRSAATSARPRP
jgi:chromosome segregation protein